MILSVIVREEVLYSIEAGNNFVAKETELFPVFHYTE